ncbi:MAG: 2,3-bisphosphoglycerate-independent phosphoglycerate mutase [Syntrophomonadaceae bacterium]|nr:2,3-bisphosphoglycerate-independent phosphoglycerate mutase [Syntrophomonadaceae bacterium]
MKRPLLLMILDGWGEAPPNQCNAVTCALTPNFNQLLQNYPHTLLETSGEAVGLPAGQMGNSEVGHLNIGAGRIVYQELTRIDRAIRSRELLQNSVFGKAIETVQHNGSALHLLGLLSDGGVHSHIQHLFGLLDMAREKGLEKVWVHAFLDGRDVPPASALTYIEALERKMQELGVGQLATLGGRYWGMDRDKRWERVEKHYRALVEGEGVKALSARVAVEQAYAASVTDEFVEPTVLVDAAGRPRTTIQDGDAVIFFNFRADRAREMTRVFVDREFDGFKRTSWPKVHFVCMTQYDVTIPAPVAFPPVKLKHTLGEVLAQHGLKQLRIAETEKYAHVTFFFNGGVEAANPGEDRILIASPKVATYDLKPEMSADEVTERVIQEIQADKYDVIILNYANADMVGHTGIMEAAVAAITALDICIDRVVKAVLKQGGAVIITADHGNAEEMREPETGQPQTAHTTGPVPFILVDPDYRGASLRPGSLQDIAPTLLYLLQIPPPAEMTGRNLLKL